MTLIFSLDRYRAVQDAYLSGLERAHAAGRDLSTIRSVASFFISRVDTEVDARLDQLGTPAAAELKGSAAVANARLAYQGSSPAAALGRSGRSGPLPESRIPPTRTPSTSPGWSRPAP